MVPEIPTYLQDTPDLLRQLEDLKLKDLPIGSFPVSIDVVGLYTNIPHDEGIKFFEQKLETRKDKTLPTEFLVNLLKHVLKSNIFEFNKDLFLQKIGTAMGTRVAPTYANIFMSNIDVLIQNSAKEGEKEFIYYYKRFIDDILVIWTGTQEQL